MHPDKLGAYLRDFQQILDDHGYRCVYYGHFGQGCVHTRMDFDLKTAAGVKTFRSFMEKCADLVVSYGGSLAGEYGEGHGRAELLPKMFGPELMAAFNDFKRIWDPDVEDEPEPADRRRQARRGPPARPRLPPAAADRPTSPSPTTKGRSPPRSSAASGWPSAATSAASRCARASTSPARSATRRAAARGCCSRCSRATRSPTAGATTRSRSRSTCAWPARAAPATARSRSTSRPTRPSSSPTTTRSAGGRCTTTCSGLLPWWGPVGGARAAAGQRAQPRARRSPGRQAAARDRRGARDPAVRAPDVPRAGSRAPRSAGPRHAGTATSASCCGPTRSPTCSSPTSARPRSTCSRRPGSRSSSRHKRVCCGRPLYDFGMLGAGQANAARHARRRCPSRSSRACRCSCSSRAARRCSATSCASSCLTTSTPAGSSAQTVVLDELLERHAPGWEPPRVDRSALIHGHCHHKARDPRHPGPADLLDARRRRGRDDERGLLRDGRVVRLRAPASSTTSRCGSASSSCCRRSGPPTADTLLVADGFSCRTQIDRRHGPPRAPHRRGAAARSASDCVTERPPWVSRPPNATVPGRAPGGEGGHPCTSRSSIRCPIRWD